MILRVVSPVSTTIECFLVRPVLLCGSITVFSHLKSDNRRERIPSPTRFFTKCPALGIQFSKGRRKNSPLKACWAVRCWTPWKGESEILKIESSLYSKKHNFTHVLEHSLFLWCWFSLVNSFCPWVPLLVSLITILNPETLTSSWSDLSLLHSCLFYNWSLLFPILLYWAGLGCRGRLWPGALSLNNLDFFMIVSYDHFYNDLVEHGYVSILETSWRQKVNCTKYLGEQMIPWRKILKHKS